MMEVTSPMDVDVTTRKNSQTERYRKRLKMHRLPITCLCIDAKDEHAFTASKDGSIIKWSLKVRKMLARVESIKKSDADKDKELHKRHHVKHISALAISSDNKFLASGGWDKHIRIWSPQDLTWLHIFTLHRQEITSLAFRRDNLTLYSGSNDRSVMIWSLEDDDNRCFVEALYGHESPITSMDSSRKERVLTTGGLDQSIRIWKIVEQAQTVFQSTHQHVDVARLIDDKTFVSGGQDGSICIWTTMKRNPLLIKTNAHILSQRPDQNGDAIKRPTSKAPGSWITSLAAFPIKNSNKNSSGGAKKRRKLDDNQEKICDESDASENDVDKNAEDELPEDTDGALALIASGSSDSYLRLWSLNRNKGKYELNQLKTFDCPGFINDLRFTSDGLKVIAACAQEHRFGRWWKLEKVKNCMHVFDVNEK